MMAAYKNMGFDIKDYPNAYKRFENEITLPLHTRLKDEEVKYVIEQYCKIVGSIYKNRLRWEIVMLREWDETCQRVCGQKLSVHIMKD